MASQIVISHQPTWNVLEQLKGLPVPLYVVGGTVRDLLLFGKVRDVDALVRGDASEAAHLLASLLQGTCFQMHGEPITFRVVPGDLDLPHVDLLQMGSGDEPEEDALRGDLLRRDFTVNAMAARLTGLNQGVSTLDIVDPCRGRDDLSARLLRPVSRSALADDPVRMLRCFRLAAGLDFQIAPEALEQISRDHQLVTQSAPERIQEELMLLLDITPCSTHLELAQRTGLLYGIIPELQAMDGVPQDGYHHLDVLEHTLEAFRQLERMLRMADGEKVQIGEDLMRKSLAHLDKAVRPGITRRALLKLAVLLHDVGKPQAKTVEPEGRIRFIGHNLLGAEMAREVGRRLRLGKRPAEMLAKMVREHMRPGFLASESSPTERATNRFLNQAGDLAVEILLLELADRFAARGPAPRRLSMERHARFTRSLLATYWARQGQEGPPRLVDGHEIMARFNIRPGRLVGQLLAIVKEAQQEGRLRTKEEAISLLDEVFPSANEHVEDAGG